MADATAQTILNDTVAKVAELRSGVDASLGALKSAASLPYLSWFDFSATAPLTLIPAATDRQRITIDDLPQLQRAAMDTPMAFDYSPELFTTLQNHIMAIVESGGQNIAPAVQDAVFNQGYERLMQTQKDGLDLTGARTGSKGFRYPNSMTKGFQAEIVKNFIWQRADLSREIVRTMADLFQKNLQMALAAGVEVQKALSDIALKTYTVLLEAQRLVVEKFKAETEAYVAAFEGQLKGLLAELEAYKIDQTLQLSYQDQIIRKWDTEVRILLEKGKAQIAQAESANTVKVALIEHIANAYIGLMQNIGTQSVAVVTKKT